MIIEIVGIEIEKIKGDFESYLNGLNMVGAISYSLYSKLYDEGTKQIQRTYELGKSDLEKKNAELKEEIKNNEDLATVAYMQGADSQKKKAEKQLIEAKEIINNCVYELQNILIHKM